MKRKVYIARRIASNTDPDVLLPVTSSMSVQEVHKAYTDKIVERDTFIHNGHWILRPASREGDLAMHNLPENLNPQDIRNAVLNKIHTSDAFVAILNHEAFGAIAELGYAAGTGKIAVYVLPEPQLTRQQILELWLSFQIAMTTKDHWCLEDIEAIPEFVELGVKSVEEYSAYIDSLVPSFLIP